MTVQELSDEMLKQKARCRYFLECELERRNKEIE